MAPPQPTTDLALVKSLTRHWIVALLAFSVCLALGAAAAFLPEKSYEATSTVWGMPGSIAKAGLAHEILPLAAIAPAIKTAIIGSGT